MQRLVPTGTGAVEPTKPQPSGEVMAAPPIKTKTNNKKAVPEVSIKRESFLHNLLGCSNREVDQMES